MPFLSVIVPVYKVEKYIDRCINSILNQSYTDFELILVDDGSPDDCGKICDNYALSDKRIKVIHKNNGGLSDARNVGITAMNGQYVTFIDSDDYIHKEMFSFMIGLIKKENADISICSFKRTDKTDFDCDISENYQVFDNRESVMQIYANADSIAFITAWGKIYKASLFENIRYPKGKLHEDEFTTYKLFYSSKKVVYTSNKFYFYFTNPQSIIQSVISEKKLDFIDALKERISFFENYNEPLLAKLTSFSMIAGIMYSYQRISREKSENYKLLKAKFLSHLDKTKKNEYISSQKGKNKIWAKLFFFSPDFYSFIRNFLKIGL